MVWLLLLDRECVWKERIDAMDGSGGEWSIVNE